MRSLSPFIFLSLVVHLTCLILLRDKAHKLESPPAKEIIEFQIATSQNSKIQNVIKGEEKSLSQDSVKSKGHQSGVLTYNNRFSIEPSDHDDMNTEGGWHPSDWGSGGGSFTSVVNYLPLTQVADQVDGLLNYPSALALRKIEGHVLVKLEIAETGGCLWKQTNIQSSQAYFRIYVLALLKKLCALEPIQKLKLNKGERIDMSFTFVTKNRAEYKLRPPYSILGNIIHFERHELAVPTEMRLGPVRVYGPYVAMDFVWLFERWDQYTKGRDPLEEFR